MILQINGIAKAQKKNWKVLTLNPKAFNHKHQPPPREAFNKILNQLIP